MENFVVSARKYRPVTFDSVVGQLSITSTLKNAIKTEHLAQAFLFCGPRGVGKTTCARILAKTINCFNITENIEACDECESCKSFNDGHSLNIYELDAASNNSVDDIRNLIDQVRFAPQLGSKKVYIIDEVHMLSAQAFNAFLKTLEEPPKHAIFILATTEKHKIIPTILSRCQIFDFNRIQIEDIATTLANIAQKENIKAENDALHIIAQKADGALRDALSIFDQIVSFSGNNITYQNVIDNLNILDYDYYFKLTDAIFEHKIGESLLIFNDILSKGFDGHNFINGLAEHFRNLLICQDVSTLKLLEVGENIKEKYKEQALKGNTLLYVSFLDITSKADTSYKSSKNQRLLVEVMLMQLCSVNHEHEKKKPIINLPFNKTTDSLTSTPKTLPVQKTGTTSPNLQKNLVNEAQSSHYGNEVEKQPTPPDSPDSYRDQKSTITLKNLSSVNFSQNISIHKTAHQKKGEEVAIQELSNRPTEPFTIELFKQKWSAYKHLLIEKGETSLASAFENMPELIDEKIIVTINNKALEDEIIETKTDILDFLRKELKNYNLSLETKINIDQKTRKAYTPMEKFVKMSEKNPHLITLVKTFDMDISYPKD
ncbi:MAG: DNA polymerase III subunit gamma/tau [Bacteroidetes bacterium]|nr:DNA polymerase III subunit gamma/tau [Bacteroidota bacterium]